MNQPQPRPIPESYWVEDRFLAGEYPGHFDAETARKRLDTLIEAGFNTFIDLTKLDETTSCKKSHKSMMLIFNITVLGLGILGCPRPS